MKILTKPYRATLSAARKLAAILMMSAAVSATGATGAPKLTKPASGEAAAVARQVWNKLLTPCGDKYFYAGSGFDFEGMTSLMPTKPGLTKTEYRGVRFTQVAIPASEAQRLDGVQAHARITMIARVYKTGEDDGWKDGPALQPRNTNDIFAKVIAAGMSDAGRLGTNGAMALEIAKYNGTWAVARSSVNLSGPQGNFYTLKGILDAPTPRIDCGTGEIKFKATGS